MIVTGPITPDESLALTEYFLKIQAGITNGTAVLDPRGELVFGVTHRIPFSLNGADMGVDAILLGPAPYYIDFRLEAPDGTIVTPVSAGVEPAIQFVSTPRVSYYRAALPMLRANPGGSHAGQWYALLSLGERARGVNAELVSGVKTGGLPYSLLIHAYSNLRFVPSLTQTSFEPGATVTARAVLTQYDIPLDTAASAWADVQRPDLSRVIVPLKQVEAGRFEGSFAAAATGVYTVLIHAAGSTLEAQPFQREQRLTAVVFPGGDQPPRQPPDTTLCELLSCLLSDHVLGGRLLKQLEALGINVKALRACLEACCRKLLAPTLGGEQPFTPTGQQTGPSVLPDVSALLSNPEVRSLLTQLIQQISTPGAAEGFADLRS